MALSFHDDESSSEESECIGSLQLSVVDDPSPYLETGNISHDESEHIGLIDPNAGLEMVDMSQERRDESEDIDGSDGIQIIYI